MIKQKILANWNYIEREYKIESSNLFGVLGGLLIGGIGGVGIAPEIPKFIATDNRSKFYEEICRYCDSKNFSETELYNRAKISRAVFSNIRSMSRKDYLPSKSTAVRICLALELSKDQSQKLLEILGYHLSDSLIVDKVIAWCMENRCFDINDIDDAIHEQTGKFFLTRD